MMVILASQGLPIPSNDTQTGKEQILCNFSSVFTKPLVGSKTHSKDEWQSQRAGQDKIGNIVTP